MRKGTWQCAALSSFRLRKKTTFVEKGLVFQVVMEKKSHNRLVIKK